MDLFFVAAVFFLLAAVLAHFFVLFATFATFAAFASAAWAVLP